MTGCTGCPSADVARTKLLLQYGEMMHISPLLAVVLSLVKRHIGKVYYKEYKRLSAVTDEEVDAWIVPIAAARMVEWVTDGERKKLLKLVREKGHNYLVER